MLDMPATLPCPFCGADAEAKWMMDPQFGKTMHVGCSRDGECPSPAWQEAANEHEDDAHCIKSVIGFWNTRAADWDEEGWQSMRGPKPKVPVLIFTMQRAAERKLADAIGVDAPEHQPYAIARWQKGNWRDVRDGRIYMARAWKHLSPPKWL